MKLIAIFSIEEFKQYTERLFKELQVPVFSELDVKGIRIDQTNTLNSWFGSSNHPTYSTLNFAFLDDGKAEQLMNKIKTVNNSNELERPIHAFQLGVEKFV